MDKELIERLAKESGLLELLEQEMPAKWQWDELDVLLPKFVALVAEECAKVCDDAAEDAWEYNYPDPKFAAANIRAKFPPPT